MTTEAKQNIKSAIFSFQPKAEIISVFGVEVEIRQMSTGAILSLKENEDRSAAMVDSIIGHCFVPVTGEKLFDETDKEALLATPFGEDMLKLSKAIGEISGVDLDIEEEVKNSEETLEDSVNT